jgi:hypothetical protein
VPISRRYIAHRVVGLADGPGCQIQLRAIVIGDGLVFLAAQAQAPEVRGLGGVDQLDVLLPEHDDDVVDLVAVDDLRRQHVVDLVIGQEPLLLAVSISCRPGPTFFFCIRSSFP